ncbi:MAG: YciI family protein [Candidatus Sericytochromatia bacterium]
MKHFIIKLTYTAPLEEIDKSLVEHRTFLQKGYDDKILLFSGRMNPPSGGLIVARNESLEKLQDFFKEDPFYTKSLANYEYTEFSPAKYQNFLVDWI